MVVIAQPRRGLAAALVLLVALLAAPPSAAESKLSDAWLATLHETPQRVVWSHAFALRDTTATRLEAQRSRLIAELDTLIFSARLAGNVSLSSGLSAWRQTLADNPTLPARTPGRFDLPWLGAHLRYDPPLATVQHWGHCRVPEWVEIWHLAGVTRLPWHAGLGLDQALDALPNAAHHGIEHAVVITPNGARISRGTAAWNHQPAPLTPGSRVVLALPTAGQRTSPLPAAVNKEITLINQRLPAYLATRLPGDECMVL